MRYLSWFIKNQETPLWARALDKKQINFNVKTTADLCQFLEMQHARDVVKVENENVLVIATAMNKAHMWSMAQSIKRTLKTPFKKEQGWTIIDTNLGQIHLFLEEQRKFYDLESLSSDIDMELFYKDTKPRYHYLLQKSI